MLYLLPPEVELGNLSDYNWEYEKSYVVYTRLMNLKFICII